MVRSPLPTYRKAAATSALRGQQLNYGGRNEGNPHLRLHPEPARSAARARQRSQCTTGPFRYLAIHMNEAARQRARDLRTTPEFGQGSATAKRRSSALCRTGESQSHRPRSAPAPQVEVRTRQFFLAATAQNIWLNKSGSSAKPTMSPVPFFIGQGPSPLTQLQSSIHELPERGRLFSTPTAQYAHWIGLGFRG